MWGSSSVSFHSLAYARYDGLSPGIDTVAVYTGTSGSRSCLSWSQTKARAAGRFRPARPRPRCY